MHSGTAGGLPDGTGGEAGDADQPAEERRPLPDTDEAEAQTGKADSGDCGGSHLRHHRGRGGEQPARGTGKRNYRGRQGFYRAAHSGESLFRLYRGAYRHQLRAEGKPGRKPGVLPGAEEGRYRYVRGLYRHPVRKRAEA